MCYIGKGGVDAALHRGTVALRLALPIRSEVYNSVIVSHVTMDHIARAQSQRRRTSATFSSRKLAASGSRAFPDLSYRDGDGGGGAGAGTGSSKRHATLVEVSPRGSPTHVAGEDVAAAKGAPPAYHEPQSVVGSPVANPLDDAGGDVASPHPAAASRHMMVQLHLRGEAAAPHPAAALGDGTGSGGAFEADGLPGVAVRNGSGELYHGSPGDGAAAL